VLKCLLMLVVFLGIAPALHAQDSSTPKPVPSGVAAVATSAAAPAQPIPFNHQLHIQTAKMSCNDCHEPRGDGSTLAMPQPAKCMLCHAAIATDKPDIKRLADAAKNEETIPWVRVYRVPSFVTFSHKTHTASGNTCEECHGPVAERTAIVHEKDVSMGGCVACHQAKSAPVACDTCHAPMSKNGRPPFDVDSTVLARLQLHSGGKPSTSTKSSIAPDARGTSQFAALASFLKAPML
jgi:hypothetical protein